VKPIGTDQQIESTRFVGSKLDLDLISVLRNGLNRIAEQKLNTRGVITQDLTQETTNDFQVVPYSMPKLIATHFVQDGTVTIDEYRPLHIRAFGNDGVMDVHASEDLQRCAAHIDLVPACDEARRSFDDCGREPIALQPIGSGQSRRSCS